MHQFLCWLGWHDWDTVKVEFLRNTIYLEVCNYCGLPESEGESCEG